MPQLDHVTYFSQYFWLCVVFFGFYGLCVKFYLPGLTRLAKYRAKTQNQGSLNQEDSTSLDLDISLPEPVQTGLNAAFDFSAFIDSLKPLSPFSSLSKMFAWRRDSYPADWAWKDSFLREFKSKKDIENRRFAALITKGARESSLSNQTLVFGGISSTKSAYLNVFDILVLKSFVSAPKKAKKKK